MDSKGTLRPSSGELGATRRPPSPPQTPQRREGKGLTPDGVAPAPDGKAGRAAALVRQAMVTRPDRPLRKPMGSLDGAAAFVERAGRPKDDIRFLGLTLWRRSTAYKEILEQLDLCAPDLDTPLAAGPPDRAQALDIKTAAVSARAGLVRLEGLAKAYLDTPRMRRKPDFDPRKQAMRTLVQQVQERVTALRLLESACLTARRRDAAWAVDVPAGACLKDLLPHAGDGLTLSAAIERMKEDMPQPAPRVGDPPGPAPAHTPALYDHKAMASAMVSDADAILLESVGLEREVGALYAEAGVPISRRTLPPGPPPPAQVGEMQQAGKGAFNTTFNIRLRNMPDQATGAAGRYIFKSVPQTERGFGLRVGIQAHHPKSAQRNLATCDVARLLGFDVVVKTFIGIGTRPGMAGGPRPLPQLGLVMEPAPGRQAMLAAHDDATLFRNPRVIAKVQQLQVLDLLTAQTDRHGCNYFISVAPDGEVTVEGIDNDQSFGAQITDPRMYSWLPDDRIRGATFLGTLPTLLDEEMAKAIENLSEVALESAVQACGLDAAEVEATVARLRVLKSHVADLRQAGRIIDPADWGTDENIAHLRSAGAGSYVGRRLLHTRY